jgi:hypothetical protein
MNRNDTELGLSSGFHVPGSWGEQPSRVGVDMASGNSVAQSAADNLKRLMAERGVEEPRVAGIHFNSPSDMYLDWANHYIERPAGFVEKIGLSLRSPRGINSYPFQGRPVAILPSPRLHTHAFSRSSRLTKAGERAKYLRDWEIPGVMRVLSSRSFQESK